jgi:hypothetical protein
MNVHLGSQGLLFQIIRREPFDRKRKGESPEVNTMMQPTSRHLAYLIPVNQQIRIASLDYSLYFRIIRSFIRTVKFIYEKMVIRSSHILFFRCLQ